MRKKFLELLLVTKEDYEKIKNNVKKNNDNKNKECTKTSPTVMINYGAGPPGGNYINAPNNTQPPTIVNCPNNFLTPPTFKKNHSINNSLSTSSSTPSSSSSSGDLPLISENSESHISQNLYNTLDERLRGLRDDLINSGGSVNISENLYNTLNERLRRLRENSNNSENNINSIALEEQKWLEEKMNELKAMNINEKEENEMQDRLNNLREKDSINNNITSSTLDNDVSMNENIFSDLLRSNENIPMSFSSNSNNEKEGASENHQKNMSEFLKILSELIKRANAGGVRKDDTSPPDADSITPTNSVSGGVTSSNSSTATVLPNNTMNANNAGSSSNNFTSNQTAAPSTSTNTTNANNTSSNLSNNITSNQNNIQNRRLSNNTQGRGINNRGNQTDSQEDYIFRNRNRYPRRLIYKQDRVKNRKRPHRGSDDGASDNKKGRKDDIKTIPINRRIIQNRLLADEILQADPKNPYAILKISKDANLAEARKSYRDILKRLHPDKNDSKSAHEAFIRVQKAYAEITRIFYYQDLFKNHNNNPQKGSGIKKWIKL